MSKVLISAAQAAKLLPRRKKVHTFIRVFGWMGGTADRDALLEAFNAVGDVEVSQVAAGFDHFLAIKTNGMVTYIETNLTALAKMGLLPPRRIPA